MSLSQKDIPHVPNSSTPSSSLTNVLDERFSVQKSAFEAHAKTRQKAAADVKERLANFGLQEAHHLLIERLVDIEYYAQNHNRDALLMAYEVMDILARYNIENLEKPINQDLMQKTMTAVLLHDIGKSGPVSYTDRQGEEHWVDAEDRKAILKIYADETPIRDLHEVTVEEWVYTLFGMHEGARYSEDPEETLQALERCGIERYETMRQFFNRHATDTYEILKVTHLDGDTVAIACSHHMLEGINPVHLDGTKIPKEAKMIELTEKYVKQFIVRMLITLDKYEAFRRRGKKDHNNAITQLQDMLQKRGLADDAGYMCTLHLLDVTKGAFLES